MYNAIVMNYEKMINEDIESRIALLRSLQNQADLAADASDVADKDKIEDFHSGFENFDEVDSK